MYSNIQNVIHPADILPDTMDEIYSRRDKPKDLSISFLPTVDNRIWGLKRKKLVVVAGRTSMGKSTFALQMAYNFALQGKRVFFFSLEMTKEVCVERMVSMGCKIDNFLLKTGMVVDDFDAYKRTIETFYSRLSRTYFVLVEGWGRRFNDIYTIITKFEKPDVVFIDHINRIKGADKESIDEYIKDLRNLAVDKNFCVVLGAQINREVYKTKDGEIKCPGLWHLKGSGNLEEDADMVFILHWDYYYIRDPEIKNDFILKIAKNRDGRTGIFKIKFYPEYYSLGEENGAEEITV